MKTSRLLVALLSVLLIPDAATAAPYRCALTYQNHEPQSFDFESSADFEGYFFHDTLKVTLSLVDSGGVGDPDDLYLKGDLLMANGSSGNATFLAVASTFQRDGVDRFAIENNWTAINFPGVKITKSRLQCRLKPSVDW